jgi:hypothetical protein
LYKCLRLERSRRRAHPVGDEASRRLCEQRRVPNDSEAGDYCEQRKVARSAVKYQPSPLGKVARLAASDEVLPTFFIR